MTNELATILHKLDRDAEERAEEREWKRIQMEKEEERKRMVLEAELEEKRREQERRHEIQMQSMMLIIYNSCNVCSILLHKIYPFTDLLLLQCPFCLLVMTCLHTYHLAVPLMTLINFVHTLQLITHQMIINIALLITCLHAYNYKLIYCVIHC